MCSTNAAPSISRFCINEPRVHSGLKKEQEQPSCQPQSGKERHERAPLCSRTNAQSTGSLLAALRPVWNWGSSSKSYLLRKSLPAPASHPLFSQLFFCPLLFLSSFSRVLLPHLCEIFRVFFLALICCILLPNTFPLLLCNFHSSFLFTLVYLQIPPQSFVIPLSMSFFYLSFNFFQPSYQLFLAHCAPAPGFWSRMVTLDHAYQFKSTNKSQKLHRLIFCIKHASNEWWLNKVTSLPKCPHFASKMHILVLHSRS